MAINVATKESVEILEKIREYRGQDFRYCLLNEKAFNLLIMGFSGVGSLQYKSEFYDAFKRMEKFIKENHNNSVWVTARSEGKLSRKTMTDATQQLVNYATMQGSKNAEFYYKHLTMMEYKSLEFIQKANENLGNNFRDTLDMLQLNQLFIAEKLVETTITNCISDSTHYTEIYKECKRVVEVYAESTKMLRAIDYREDNKPKIK